MDNPSFESLVAPRLPRLNLRDWVNDFRQDLKFRWPPFRAYYRLRAYKYMLYRDREMGLLKFLVDPTRISLDIGANLGLFSFFLSRLSPKVMAFEPNPYPLRTLMQVADRNVEIFPMAIGDSDGPVRLTIPRSSKGWMSNGASIEKAIGGASHPVDVMCHRIDTLSLAPVGFIKIDVEGHELAVLQGARETILRDRPAIFLETEYIHIGDRVLDVFRFCADLGYRGFFLGRNGLSDIALFDIERHQKHRGPDYVKNFIFLPGASATAVPAVTPTPAA
ncbi:MAG: FkbM family methyltransferase [Parvibaculum sp.]|uniref:FkbM family methyltransferase n=1 Tax=Parvibaculum sp. TaxID=2024848 RepID=UPI0032EF34E3